MKFPRFLRFYQSVRISRHALQRAGELAGEEVDAGQLRRHLDDATHLRGDEVFDRGYRPAHGRRRRSGVKSWYFAGVFCRWQVVFVLIENRRDPGELVCVTIYFRDRQNELLDRSAMTMAARAGGNAGSPPAPARGGPDDLP